MNIKTPLLKLSCLLLLFILDIDSSAGAVGQEVSATPPSELTALSPPTKTPTKRNRCHTCRKKVGLTGKGEREREREREREERRRRREERGHIDISKQGVRD